MGQISDETLNELAMNYGTAAIDLSFFEVNPEVAAFVSQEFAERFLLVPISRVGPVLTVAMADPQNLLAIDDVRFITGCHIQALAATEETIRKTIAKVYASIPDSGDEEIEAFDARDAISDSFKLNLSLSTKSLEEESTPLLAGALEQAKAIPASTKVSDIYFCDGDNNVNFQTRARALIREAMKNK